MEVRTVPMRVVIGKGLLIVTALVLASCDNERSIEKSKQSEPVKAAVEQSPASDPTVPPPPAAPSDVAAPSSEAERTASGLAFKVLKPGATKDHPGPTDVVEVHYTGWTTQGKMFDSSVARGKPSRFPVNRVIKGWSEGLQLMTVGEKRRFWIPGSLAYGESPSRPGALAGTLVFDVELLSFSPSPPPPPPRAELSPKDEATPYLKIAEKTRRKTVAPKTPSRATAAE